MICCIKYRETLFGKGKGEKVNTVLFAMAMKRVIPKKVDLRDKTIICTVKVYLFSKREEWNFSKWEKYKDKYLIWHMMGEMVKK